MGNHSPPQGHLLSVNIYGYDWRGQGALRVSWHVVRSPGVAVIVAQRPEGASSPPPAAGLQLPITDAAAGDENAFARIVAAYQDDMVRVCYVITRDTESANDAVQEAWSIAWRQLAKLREPDRLRQWLVAIAANEARQIVRRQRRVVVTETQPDTQADDDEGTRIWSGRIDLRNAMGRLSAQDRELLALRYVAGFDSSELSRVTGLSPSGTRARLQRLLAQLRDELEPAQ